MPSLGCGEHIPGRGGELAPSLITQQKGGELLCYSPRIASLHTCWSVEWFNFLAYTNTQVKTVWWEPSFLYPTKLLSNQRYTIFCLPLGDLYLCMANLRACGSRVNFPSLAGHCGNQERGNGFSSCLSVYRRTERSQDSHKYLFSWNCLHMTLVNSCWHWLLLEFTHGNCCEVRWG